MYVSMLAISVLVFIAALYVYLRHPAASVFHPATFYLLFHGLVFVVRPIFAWHYRFDNMYTDIGFLPSPWEKTLALVCANLAFVVFMAASLWVARNPIRFTANPADAGQRQWLLRRFWWVAVPFGLIAASSLLWRWDAAASGRVVGVFDPEAEAFALQGVSGYFVGAAAMLAPITAMIAYLGRFRLLSLVPFAAFSVVRLGTGKRADFVAAAVMVGLLLLVHLRKKWPTVLIVLGGLGLALVFDGIQESRGAIIREIVRPDVEDRGEQWRAEEAPLESMDIALMEFVEYMVWAVPKRTGSYNYFIDNLQIVTEPIPRAVWPGKPVGPPIKLFDLHPDTNPVGESFSVPGMGWYYAGYAGVVLWSALFALIYAGGHRWLVRSGQGQLATIAYVLLLATSVLAFRDGLLLTVIRQLAFYGAPLVALALLVRYGPQPAFGGVRERPVPPVG